MKKALVPILVFSAILVSMTVCTNFAWAVERPANTGQKFVMRIATSTNNDCNVYVMEQFKKEVEAKTDQISIETYPAGQLGSNAKVVQDVITNNSGVQGIVMPPSFFGIFSEGATLVTLPLLFPNPEAYIEIMNFEQPGDLYREYVRKLGVDMLGFYLYDGKLGYANSFKIGEDVKITEALKGKKIRVTGSQMLIDQATFFGASAVTMDVPELYTSLQQGTIDGMHSALTFLADGSYYQVAPHLFLLPEYNPTQFMVNVAFMDSLPQDLYDICQEAAYTIQDKVMEYVYNTMDEALAQVLENGGSVTYPTNLQLADIIEVSEKVKENFLAANSDIQPIYDAIQVELKKRQ